MFRTALRNVLVHKARLLMTVLAVMLGVAFVSGTLVFTNTISDAFQKSSAKGFDHVDVAIRPEGRANEGGKVAEQPKLTPELLTKVEQVPGAESAIGVVSGFTALADKDGKLIGGGFQSQGGNLWGTDDPRYPIEDGGRAPKGEDEVAIDAETADRAGYKVGDTIRISVDGPVLTPTITAIFTTDDGNVAAGGSLALFDTATAQKLFHMEGTYDEIDVQAAGGTGQAQLKAAVDKVVPADTAYTTTGKELADSQAEMIASSMSGLKNGLLVFAGIALFVGTFIIANTFTMLVAQRTKELALLRAVGASRRQVTRSVLIEAFVVGVIAAVTGLVAGVGIGAGMRSLMGTLDATVPDGPLIVSPGTVVTALLVGVLVTMLAAWLPGRRAAKIPPVAAMSSVHAKATTKSLVVRNTIGALFAGAGIATVLYATTMDGTESQITMGFGAVLLIIGVFVLTPLLSRPLIAAADPVLRVFGVSGKLARQNSVRNPRRTAATASALMIGLTLITGMTVMAGSLQTSIGKMAADSIKADYVVSMANRNYLSPDVEKKLAATEGVTATSPLTNAESVIGDETEYLTGVNGSAIGELTDLTVDSGAFKVGGSDVVVDADTAKRRGWKAGSTFTAAFEGGQKQKLTVAGVYEGNDLLRGILLDSATLSERLPASADPADMQVMVKTSAGVSDATKDRLEKALGSNPGIRVQDRQDISNEIAQMFTLMLNMLYGLLAMAVIVAVLGVINTLAMSVFERSQEIGMLRAIGLDRRGIKRMVRLESLVISLFGGVLGIGLGVFFGWAAGELLAAKMPTYELVLPWARMAVFLLLAATVGILAALWPARRAAKLNMLTAIKSE
ncbi:ABC transporter permease [Streptomyces ipomoeae]|jgi:putative ABC transport system permease protein|uniref:Efflux ABC transporter, permease protein n=1 Tax=Streptomyces ipomoeae 91-03 TaxID=698759 RepID=L1L8N2_9ACTN|nr:FtsX-like permease family protein [Streptomyces ipomoeae]EKX68988.1 efflux ABC transporter, permease protein [Streptomyces ipomoeae 91-03]MDX2694478.1 ABC transporter permease [Streptomyces ipomoeae]MDX2822654.1 ABC transporter permease [Streptomyces ipomoeae]MDX2840942.1 ABC transporter permease [Streptomyces ipomoeae]MDX2875303.1 ABC transporter permease [Streptomyces ipomoeae]